MYGVIASCVVSCATTLVINVLIHRKRQHRRGGIPAGCPLDDTNHSPQKATAADSDVFGHDATADAATSRRAADQEDDGFMFTPPKVKPTRKPEQQQYMMAGPYAMHSPIDLIKRADPYDPAPRARCASAQQRCFLPCQALMPHTIQTAARTDQILARGNH
jgi:hypothetical protein